MIKWVSNKLKKVKNSRFQKEARIEKRRLFMDLWEGEKTFKKRKRYNFKLPDWLTNKSLKTHLKILYIITLSLLVWGSIFVIYGPYFKIKTIEITRKDNITDINIAYKALEDYRDKLIFWVNSKDIAEQLKLYQKNISDVSIGKDFPDKLSITIGSYKGIFSTVINQKNYILTSNWVLVPGNGGSDLQILKFTKQYATINGIIDYKQIFNPKYIEKMIEVLSKLHYNLLSSQVKAVYYFPKEREIHADVDNIKLIFDLDGNIDDQIKRLVVFTKENLDSKKSGIIYIDLRIKNKVFFCTTETEFDCRSNLSYYYQY